MKRRIRVIEWAEQRDAVWDWGLRGELWRELWEEGVLPVAGIAQQISEQIRSEIRRRA